MFQRIIDSINHRFDLVAHATYDAIDWIFRGCHIIRTDDVIPPGEYTEYFLGDTPTVAKTPLTEDRASLGPHEDFGDVCPSIVATHDARRNAAGMQ